MDFKEAVDYIQSFTDYEKTPGIAYTAANYDLRRMVELLGRLGNPHLLPQTVHVAGTKGKGSTAAMIASVLTVSGYRTGLFTSPHLHTIRERIKVDSRLIPEKHFAALTEELRPEVETVNRHGVGGKLTTFELLTALAFAYFKQKKVDFQVLEVGLGGRLDATNVVRPGVCIITSISLDHVEVLGHTLAEIAREKAGIIKPGCVVVSAPQRPEAAIVIAEVCRQQRARLVKVGRDISWGKVSASLKGQSFELWGRTGSYDLSIPLLGDYQLENAATAVAALEELAALGATISADSIAEGLKKVSWPGRLQILGRRPLVVGDGAHNPYSAQKLRQAVAQYFKFGRCILVLGTSLDKDISGIAQEMAPLASQVIVTRSQHPRAASPSVVAAEFACRGVQAEVTQSTGEAINLARSMAKKTDLILVTGSLFVVAEAIESMRRNRHRTDS